MDKKRFPRVKLCAGWVTPAVIEALGLDTKEYSQGRIFQPITGFRSGILGRKEVEIRYENAVSFGILRCEFDDYLLQRCGARLRLGEEVKTIVKSCVGWCVNDSIEARLVIGAGGHFCPVARFMGAKVAAREVVVAAQEVEFELTEGQIRDCKVKREIPEIYFCDDLKGYGWSFRKGNFLNIGLGREDSSSVSRHTKQFLSFLKSRSRVPQDTPENFHGHAYILYGHTRREILGDGLILVGDAAVWPTLRAAKASAQPWNLGYSRRKRSFLPSGILAGQSLRLTRNGFSTGLVSPRPSLTRRALRPHWKGC
jgi:flavin-dependent dehydrogenase